MQNPDKQQQQKPADRVLLLDPASQGLFDPDGDSFALPSRNLDNNNNNKHTKSKQQDNENDQNDENNTINRKKNKADLSVGFNSATSQFQYNTYQTDYTTGGDSSDSTPFQQARSFSKNKRGRGGNDETAPLIPQQQQQQQQHSLSPSAEYALKPQSKYDMKNHMANERTFFKYLFTGLHIGSIGTLVLTFFPNDDIHKLYLVIIIWLIAFFFMFWGLYGYYKRKNLMEMGKLQDTTEISPHTPLLISSIFVGVILSVVWYGLFVHYKYENGLSLSKLLLMSEKETGNRRGRRRRRRNARNAAAAANNNSTTTTIETQGNTGGKRNKNKPQLTEEQQKELAAAVKNGENVVIVPTTTSIKNITGEKNNNNNDNTKSKNNGRRRRRSTNAAGMVIYDDIGEPLEGKPLDIDDSDAQIDDKMDIIDTNGGHHESSKNKHDDDNNDNDDKLESASIVPNFVGKNNKNSNIVTIPQTNNEQTTMDIDMTPVVHGGDDDGVDDVDHDDEYCIEGEDCTEDDYDDDEEEDTKNKK